MKTKIAELIKEVMLVSRFQEVLGVTISAAEEASNIADHLIANGVRLVPKDAIVLTREEINALNEYEKRRQGNDVT